MKKTHQKARAREKHIPFDEFAEIVDQIDVIRLHEKCTKGFSLVALAEFIQNAGTAIERANAIIAMLAIIKRINDFDRSEL